MSRASTDVISDTRTFSTPLHNKRNPNRYYLLPSSSIRLQRTSNFHKMSGTSSVGQGSVYEAGDQRNVKKSEINEAERYKEGKANSHKANDSSIRSMDNVGLLLHTKIYFDRG